MRFKLRFYNRYGDLEGEMDAWLLQTFFDFVMDFLDEQGGVIIRRAEDGAFEIYEPAVTVKESV
jgi:hypothetical protein